MGRSSFRLAALWLGATALAWASQGAASTADPSGGKVAIVVGVQRYSETKGFAPLRYAERDAESFHELLVDPERGGYDPAKVKLFTTASQDPQQLPVRGNLLAALNHLEGWSSTARGGALDTVLIYFSGHGVTEGGKSYLIPVDASRDDLSSTAISLEEVEARLARCGARKQIIILDACRFQTTPGKGAGEPQAVSFAKKLEELGRAQGRVVLASCSQDEASYEDEANRHSAFTAFLLQGLLGPADADGDGVITVTESLEYISREMLPWSRQQELKQTPRLYGELTLTLPLVRCPQWGELKITSIPSGAQVFIDGQSTGQRTPYASKIKLEQGRSRVLRLSLRKPGYQDLEKEVAVRAGVVAEIALPLENQPRPAALIAPNLKPVFPNWVASTFYVGAGYVSGLARRPDGSLLVAVASPHVVPPGVYAAYEGDLCDLKDAYTEPGPPFNGPDGVLLHPDGRVVVSDPSISTIWEIAAAGAPPQVLTKEIPEPHDVLVAPPGFEGPSVHAGDLLVCSGGSGNPAAGGLYVIDQKTRATCRLVGPPGLANGLLRAEFGPDGRLYAIETDETRDGVRIVTISADGKVVPVLDNHVLSPLAKQTGPMAVHPITGDVYFAYGSSVYRVSNGGGRVEPFATGGKELADLILSPDGASLFVSDRGTGQVVRIIESSPNAPALNVSVQRGYFVSDSGIVQYKQRVLARAEDVDGADDIASIIIVDPNGQVETITPASGTSWSRDDDHTVHCDWPTTVWEWRDQERGQPPDTGPYTVIATDASGNRSSVITPAVPPAPAPRPELLAPAPDSVIHTTTPTFQWTPGPPRLSYTLEVYDEGAVGGQPVWQCELGAHTEAVYNFDGRARKKELEPNHAYFWVVWAGRGSDVRVSDPRVSVADQYRVEGRFTVYGDWPGRPPELPGRLAYTAASSQAERQDALAYNTNASIRSYLPGAEWSPDGAKVVYAFFGRIWIDSLDGTPPVLVPGTSGVGECRWGPDGKSIVYSKLGPWSPFFGAGSLNADYELAWEPWHLSGAGVGPMDHPWGNNDVWVTTIDGSRRYPLADSAEHDERWPDWSPDSLWVAYRRMAGPKEFRRAEPSVLSEGYREGVWLARYDGTDQHPLVSSGVVGHPEYTPDPHLHTAAWSPDGRKLAVQFSTGPGDGHWAIGVMPAQGGPITSVFITPPGVRCCAGPRFPQWSPDGTKIVFASGHHLPDAGKQDEFMLGTELWMVNADGTGEPIRLTYDNLHESWSSWWAPNTEPGLNVTVTKGDASATFENVTAAGSTSLVAYVDAPQSLPEGFRFAGLRYELATTARVSGAIGLEIHYDGKSIPAGREQGLRLLHKEGDRWVDITAGPVDTASDIIRGRCTAPGAFALAIAP